MKKKFAIYAYNKIKIQFVLIQIELNRKRTVWYYLRKILNHKIMKSLLFIYLFYFIVNNGRILLSKLQITILYYLRKILNESACITKLLSRSNLFIYFIFVNNGRMLFNTHSGII